MVEKASFQKCRVQSLGENLLYCETADKKHLPARVQVDSLANANPVILGASVTIDPDKEGFDGIKDFFNQGHELPPGRVYHANSGAAATKPVAVGKLKFADKNEVKKALERNQTNFNVLFRLGEYIQTQVREGNSFNYTAQFRADERTPEKVNTVTIHNRDGQEIQIQFDRYYPVGDHFEAGEVRVFVDRKSVGSFQGEKAQRLYEVFGSGLKELYLQGILPGSYAVGTMEQGVYPPLTVQISTTSNQHVLCEGEEETLYATVSEPAYVQVYSEAEGGGFMLLYDSQTPTTNVAIPRLVNIKMPNTQSDRYVVIAVPEHIGRKGLGALAQATVNCYSDPQYSLNRRMVHRQATFATFNFHSLGVDDPSCQGKGLPDAKILGEWRQEILKTLETQVACLSK